MVAVFRRDAARPVSGDEQEGLAAKLRHVGIRDAAKAVSDGAITAAEKRTIDRAAELTHKVVAVDDFAPETISPLWNQAR